MSRLTSYLIFAVYSVGLATPALAQTAQLRGRVTDPQHAVVAGAEVRVASETNGSERRVVTDNEGLYAIPFIAPGSYRIYVAAPNFRTTASDAITLSVGQSPVFDVQLVVGDAHDQITVESSSPTLNTTDASVGTIIDRDFVQNIPLNGRSLQDLIALTPGVVTQNPQSGSTVGVNSDFSVNGQRTESNYYTVDGVSANINAGNAGGNYSLATSGSLPGGTALGTTQSLISVDALQEFRIQTSTFSAEYGRVPGGQVMLETRSGTNRIHASGYEYLRNNYFDANNWFNDQLGVPTAPLRQNDFGGTIGGPVWLPHVYDGKNKTFFFVSYEGLRLIQPQPASAQFVPSLSLRTASTGLVQSILNAFPLPTGPEATVACNNSTYACGGAPVGSKVPSGLSPFSLPYSSPSQVDSTSARIDQSITSKISLFFRAGITPTSTTTRSLSAVSPRQLNSQQYTLGLNAQISNRSTNEFRLGYARSDSAIAGHLDNFGGAVPIDLPAVMGSTAPGVEPLFFENISGVGYSLLAYLTTTAKMRQWNALDTASVALGPHQFKFGVDYRRIASPTTLPNVLEAYYTSSQAIQNNSATQLVLQKELPGTPTFTEFAAFAQDEWRISSRLNASFGVRWEVDPPPVGQSGNSAYTLQGDPGAPSSLTLAPAGTALWHTTWFNFAPRAGLAWVARNKAGYETVVRGGAGIFFDTDFAQAAMGFSGLGFIGSNSLVNQPLPATSSQLSFSPSVTPPYTSTTVYAFPAHLQLPYTIQSNVSVQQALGAHQSLTVSWVAAEGRRLLAEQEFMFGKINPNFGTIIFYDANLTSDYQALQSRFQRTMGRGLAASLAWTWSHAIDYGSNSQVLQPVRGNSDFDVRQNVQGGFTWDVPNPLRGSARFLLEHWGLDGRLSFRTALPVAVAGSLATDPATGSYYRGGLNFNSGVPLYLYSAGYPGGRAINKAAFSLPATTLSGNAPRNFVRGFNADQLNFAVRREFPLAEGLRLQFRAEVFNILNHPNFGFIDATYTDAAFGLAQKTLSSSLGTLAQQYQQGGARSMQFALKLLF